MNWFITENKKRVSIFDIPCLSIEELRQEIINLNKRVVGFFGKREDNNIKLFVVMADDSEGKLYISSCLFSIVLFVCKEIEHLRTRMKRYDIILLAYFV